MKNYKDKKVFFSGHGEKIEKDELLKYLIQHQSVVTEDLEEAQIIIQGYMTPVYIEDKFYLLSKNNIEVIPIKELEIEFSENMNLDSIIMALKISKDKQRVIKLLKNSYFNDTIFLTLLKYYDWDNLGLHDDDDNRDISTAIVSRFCSFQETNHNIQHSPIGIYYTALETNNSNLLNIIFNLPEFTISSKNAKEDQPLTLKEVVALNPNTPKVVLMQILKDQNLDELKFLALNQSINKLISNKLFEFNNKDITDNLIKSGNIEFENIKLCFANKTHRDKILKNTDIDDEIFLFLTKELTDIEIVYLSSNNSLTTSYIDKLFEYNIDNANINLLKNKHCSRAKIIEFLDKNDKIYNITISHNICLDELVFHKLEELDDFDVDIALSFNQNTPSYLLTKLYEKNKHEINIGLSQNENTPINILMQLQINSAYNTYVANNETYREFSRNSLGIIQNDSNRFKRSTYTVS